MIDDGAAAKLFVLQEWGNARETVLEELALTRVERDTYRDNAETMNEAAARLGARVTELLEANNRILHRARDAASLITELVEVLEPFVDLRVSRFMTDGLKYDFRIDAGHIRRAAAALARARSKGE